MRVFKFELKIYIPRIFLTKFPKAKCVVIAIKADLELVFLLFQAQFWLPFLPPIRFLRFLPMFAFYVTVFFLALHLDEKTKLFKSTDEYIKSIYINA